MHPFRLLAVFVILALIGGVMVTMVIPDMLKMQAEDAADDPLTIEELGELTLSEAITASPAQAREIIAEAQDPEPATTFETCEENGQSGFQIRRSCVTSKSTNISLSGRDMAIFETIGRFENLRSVEIRGGSVETLAP